MNMFARFDENPAMTLRVIKETKRYGRTDGRTDGQRENSLPPTNKVCGGYKLQTKFAGGINNSISTKHYIKSHLELQREITLIRIGP